jgi:hypothetical protein
MVLVKNGRRSFLKKIGGTTFAATTMRFWLRNAEAQAAFPKRFLFVYTNAGRAAESRHSGTGAGYTLGAGYSPLMPFKDKFLVIDGMHIPPHTDEEHPCGKAAILTGRAATLPNYKSAGLSLDRYLANKLTAGASFFTGTYNGPGSGDKGTNPVSWNGANSPNDGFLGTSMALATKLFGSGTTLPPPPSGSAPPPPSGGGTTQSVRDQNETALYDYLMADVNRLKGIAPKSEVQKLELHVEALTQLKTTVAPKPVPTTPTTNPTTPSAPAPTPMVTRQCGTSVDVSGASNEPDRISMVIANAFACDRARIGVMRIGSEDPYHNYSHNFASGHADAPKLRAMDKEWAQTFANLLGYLDSFKEGTGSVLSNTAVIWGSECCGEYGIGQDSGPKIAGEQDAGNGVHNTGYIPFIIAGGMGGVFKTGQRILLPGRHALEMYRLLIQQMGAGDGTDFGDNKWFKSYLTEILA